MALKTLRCCGNSSLTEQRSTLRAIHTLNPPPPKYIHKLRGLSSIHLKRWRGAQGLMWGARGPFLPAVAMVVAVVSPVVSCAKATEKRKNTKISCLLAKSLFITIYCKTYFCSYIANSSVARAQVVAWPEPEPFWSNGPWHIGYRQKAVVIARTINRLCWKT
jgi:hypothetical protein